MNSPGRALGHNIPLQYPAADFVYSLRRLSSVAAVAVVAVGTLVLIGWLTNIGALKGLFSDYAPMKLNPAVAFIAGGASLWLINTGLGWEWTRRTAQALALVALAIGVITLIEYIFDFNAGIDQLVVSDTGSAAQSSQPGRMAPIAALNFTILGTALLLLSSNVRRYQYIHLVTLIAGFLSLVSVVGYLYGVRSFYNFYSYYEPVGLNTALTFILLSGGILLSRPDKGYMAVITSDHLGGFLARRILPFALIVPLAMGWLRLKGEQSGYYNTEFGIALLATSTMLVFTALILLSARFLNATDKERKRAMDEIWELNEGLERRVNERTSELENVNKDLRKEMFERGRVVEALMQSEKKILTLNEELEHRLAELTDVNKELEAFSYSVSHDLRAPLRAIDGFSRILLEDYADKLDDEGMRLFSVIRNNTQNMGQLIDDLLAFSRLGRQEVLPLEIDMSKLTRSIFDELRSASTAQSLSFSVDSLPNARGDRAMIRQVITNLLSNAIKFTRPRGVDAAIEVGCTENGSENIYYVRDNGIGFDMTYVDKLFGVFQRLHNQNEFEGTGVGLALVKRIVNRHGGRAWAEGKAGEGATFYFTLPKSGGIE